MRSFRPGIDKKTTKPAAWGLTGSNTRVDKHGHYTYKLRPSLVETPNAAPYAEAMSQWAAGSKSPSLSPCPSPKHSPRLDSLDGKGPSLAMSDYLQSKSPKVGKRLSEPASLSGQALSSSPRQLSQANSVAVRPVSPAVRSISDHPTMQQLCLKSYQKALCHASSDEDLEVAATKIQTKTRQRQANKRVKERRAAAQ